MQQEQKRGQRAEALGRSRGGFSTKVSLRAEGEGKPITVELTPGQAHDTAAFLDLMEHGSIKRLRGGRPRIRPERLAGDKGFSAQWIRDYLRKHGIRITIPRKSNNKRGGPFDRAAYRMRNRIERLINRLKQFRFIATRYDKRADSYRSIQLIGAIILWL